MTTVFCVRFLVAVLLREMIYMCEHKSLLRLQKRSQGAHLCNGSPVETNMTEIC